MSEEGQGRGTRARLRRGDDKIRGKASIREPLLSDESGAVEKRLPERGTVVEEVDGVGRLRAIPRGPETRDGFGCQGGWVRRGGHRGQGGARNGGRGRRGRGCRVLNLPKQGALHILRPRQKAEFSILAVLKGRPDILGRDTKGLRLAASSEPARGDPVPPVLWDPVTTGANTRGRRGGSNRGRGGRGRGSGRRRAFDPQHRGRARRPWPRGSHGDHRVIG